MPLKRGVPSYSPADPPPDQAAGSLLGDAIEVFSEGFALFDADARLVTSNTLFCEMNRPLEDLIAPGLEWEILLRELGARCGFSKDACARLDWMEGRLAESDASLEPLEVDIPGGGTRSITMRATRSGGFALTEADISERKQLQAAESEADVLLQKVLEACPANVIMANIGDGRIVYRSPAATELFGNTRDCNDHFARREERADFITALLPDGRVDRMRATLLRPDGTTFPSSVSARMIEYRGEYVVVSSAVDLSTEISMQRELARQRETIYQSEKMSALGELLAGVAHELNNPLSVVVGHAMMLAEETTDPDAMRRVEKIGQAAERCAGIVKSFLAMARQQPARLGPVDVAETLEAALEAFSQGPSGSETIAASLEFKPRLPPFLGDGDQIAQVLINLLTNAAQAIETSGCGDRIHITARNDEAANMIEIRVADNGPGIAPEIRGRIFDPLFTTKEVGHGTGIGLAFCHRVVTSHNGGLHLDASVKKGSEFVLRLPLARNAAPEPAHATPGPTPAPRARALVVEDEADVADMIREILLRDGYEVDHAGSAEDGLEMIRQRDYGLVLSDLNMPGLSGEGFFDAVARERPDMARRMGFVTGDTMSPAARTFLDTAGRPYLEKPVAPAELRALARDMLNETRNAGGGT
jgi:signal transduction histidine kinase/ActR/RegA family two-component response regulator